MLPQKRRGGGEEPSPRLNDQMAEFYFPTHYRPAIGVADVPVVFEGMVIAKGVILRDGTFAYDVTDPVLMKLINSGHAKTSVVETNGYFSAEIWLQKSHQNDLS
jgi:hypothetical protein